MSELKLSPKGHRYGVLPSRIDHRDYGPPIHILTMSVAAARASRVLLPSPPSGVAPLGPTKDQKSQGSCDGHASSSAGERLFRFVKGLTPQFSPAFSYYKIREFEGTLTQGDCGGQIVSGQIVADCNPGAGGFGYCPESLMPYNENDCSTPPSADALRAALTNPGGSYHNIGNNIGLIKSCIASGYSLEIGIAVYDSFESDAVARSGLVPIPSSSEQILGYHALHCGMAFDDSIQCGGGARPGAVMFQNSWGPWGCECPLNGEPGFGWLPYDFLANQNLTTDVRMAHLGKPW